MAVNNPPAFLQNAGATHNADLTRQATTGFQSGPRAAASLVPRGGVHPHLGGVAAVTQNGSPNMTVNVASGVFFIPGTEGATQGEYTCVAPSTTNLAIAAAHASLPRIDIVVAKVEDSAYSGANNTWSLAVVTGTAAGSPTVPTAPANSITLAQVAVAAAVTSILTANITDVRPYSAYGIILCRAVADYPNPALEGMVVFNMTDNNLAVYDGAVWSSAQGNQFLQRVVFTASGTFTKATYPGLKTVVVRVQGSGAAGGGAATTAGATVSAAGGGGGGAYAESILAASSLASSVTVTIGAGGVGVSGASGNDGNTSSFGAHVIASGGFGGQAIGAGGTAFSGAGGAGGNTMTGTIQIGGQSGGMGARLGSASGQTLSGTGGSSFLGGGGQPGRNAVGGVGLGYGGGGGGSGNDNSQSGKAGGNGAPGIIICDLYV